jgi:hypothetical protein
MGVSVSSVLSLAPAFFVKLALDQYLVPEKIGYLIAAGAAIIVAAFYRRLMTCNKVLFRSKRTEGGLYIRRQVYSHLMDLSFTYYDNARTGDILSELPPMLKHFRPFWDLPVCDSQQYDVCSRCYRRHANLEHTSIFALSYLCPLHYFWDSTVCFRSPPSQQQIACSIRKDKQRHTGANPSHAGYKAFGREKHSVKTARKSIGKNADRLPCRQNHFFWLPLYLFLLD